jgi:Holliday junction resolvasome RuvABC endonuclease subunit
MPKKSPQQQVSLFNNRPVEQNPFKTITRDTTQRGLLALDIATKTGYCTNNKSGVWDFTPKKDESKGLRLLKFRARLIEICDFEGIKLIAFEMPAINNKFPNFVGMEMMGVMKLICEERGIDHVGYPPATLQKWATGKGKANKPLMIQMCISNYGINPATDDEADAVHLYHMAIEKLLL